MKNLEQIRAARAITDGKSADLTGPDGGNILSKLPTLIVADGLLAAAAFAVSKGGGYQTLIASVFNHLKEVRILSKEHLADQIQELAQTQDTVLLRRATTEAVAYANYIKRFGKMFQREAKAKRGTTDDSTEE
jgi:CRISPR/Cas system CMR-associated protein Cmr5 small subunit